MKNVIMFYFATALLVATSLCYAQYTVVPPNAVPSVISFNAQFSIANSPYYINTTTTVNVGFTLLIDTGVVLYFGPQVSMIIQGTVLASGNLTNPIVFTAANVSQPWGVFQVWTKFNIISYCNFTYGGASSIASAMVYVYYHLILISMLTTNAAQYWQSINYCYIAYSTTHGMISGADYTYYTTFVNNGWYGLAYSLYVTIAPVPSVFGCTFQNNTQGAIYFPLNAISITKNFLEKEH